MSVFKNKCHYNTQTNILQILTHPLFLCSVFMFKGSYTDPFTIKQEDGVL